MPRRGRRWRAGLAVVGFICALSACHGGAPAPGHVVLSASPSTALLDEPVDIHVTGLAPNQAVTITATALDNQGERWASHASFRASRVGVLDTAHQRPLADSTYDVVDGAGLLEFLVPTFAYSSPFETFIPPLDGYRATLLLSSGSKQLATTTVERVTPHADGVRMVRFRPRRTRVYADLFEPSTRPRDIGVLVFDGSSGGLFGTLEAALLAAHGYPAMALAYFDEPGLPKTLTRIPLGYFARAVRLLDRHVSGKGRVAVWGVSRGSEAALLLGVHYPKLVAGVIGGSPSAVVNPALPDTSQPTWTIHGRAIPHVPADDFGEPNPPDRRGIIPVERLHAPMLLICGGRDEIWPSCGYAHAIIDRLHHNGSPYRPRLLAYPDAGHVVGIALPLLSQPASAGLRFGGTLAATQLGQDDAWRQVLGFLARLS